MVKIIAIVLQQLTQNNIKKRYFRKERFWKSIFLQLGVNICQFSTPNSNFLADLRPKTKKKLEIFLKLRRDDLEEPFTANG